MLPTYAERCAYVLLRKVREGHFKVVNSSSFGANPGNPYVRQSRSLANSRLDCCRQRWWQVSYWFGLVGAGKLPIFRLGQRDAVLFVGCTPPATLYFSYRSYVMTQGLDLLFASLGDSANLEVINTTSTTHSSTMALVTTADARTLADITAALVAGGLPKLALNLDGFDSSKLAIGEDTFVFLHRASVCALERNLTHLPSPTMATTPSGLGKRGRSSRVLQYGAQRVFAARSDT